MKLGQWLRGTWPRFILSNKPKNGVRYGRKLSLLEGFARVQSAFTLAKEGQEQGGMNMGCDNVGLIWAYNTGSSKDELVYTLAKCLNDLAEVLGIPIQFFHQRRRTDFGDPVADHLK